MNKKHYILIIGKIPPSIGGVTIHVKRLLNHLKDSNNEYTFYDLQYFSIFSYISQISKHKIAHNHSNNRLFLFLFTICGLIFNTKTIITFHGNLKGMNWVYNLFEKLAIKWCDSPVVLNSKSYRYASEINKRSVLISSFLPPSNEEIILPQAIHDKCNNFKKKYSYIFATNASSFAKDKYDNEIYGITNLVDIFNKIPNLGLIISDPSGHYASHYEEKIFSNILIISSPHSFSGILKLSDAFVRATTTDGDSISIKEALYYKKVVIASNCVSRPNETILYQTNDWDELATKIKRLSKNHQTLTEVKQLNGFPQLIGIYKRSRIE